MRTRRMTAAVLAAGLLGTTGPAALAAPPGLTAQAPKTSPEVLDKALRVVRDLCLKGDGDAIVKAALAAGWPAFEPLPKGGFGSQTVVHSSVGSTLEVGDAQMSLSIIDSTLIGEPNAHWVQCNLGYGPGSVDELERALTPILGKSAEGNTPGKVGWAYRETSQGPRPTTYPGTVAAAQAAERVRADPAGGPMVSIETFPFPNHPDAVALTVQRVELERP